MKLHRSCDGLNVVPNLIHEQSHLSILVHQLLHLPFQRLMRHLHLKIRFTRGLVVSNMLDGISTVCLCP